jgi:hypothetical protein
LPVERGQAKDVANALNLADLRLDPRRPSDTFGREYIRVLVRHQDKSIVAKCLPSSLLRLDQWIPRWKQPLEANLIMGLGGNSRKCRQEYRGG